MISLLAGILSGIIASMGLGGGAVLIIYLTVFKDMEQLKAQGMNLLFFIPIAALAVLLYARRGEINWKTVLPIAAGGFLGALLGIYLSGALSVKLLGKFAQVYAYTDGSIKVVTHHGWYHGDGYYSATFLASDGAWIVVRVRDSYFDCFFKKYVEGKEDKKSAAKEVSLCLINQIKEHFSVRGRISSVTQMDLNMFMIYYVFPSILLTYHDDAKLLADTLCETWNEQFKKENIGYTDYDTLHKSFREKILGLF